VSKDVQNGAMWISLVFALVVLPALAPLLLAVFEPSRHRRRHYVPFLALGLAVSGVVLETMLVGHPTAQLGSYHVTYSIGLQHGILIIGF
jgi:hypothetical protein